MTRIKSKMKFLIMLGLALLAVCIFNTSVNATTNEEIKNIIPDTINLDIPEEEYNKAQTSIANKVKEIIANSNLEDKDNLNVSADYNVLYFYEATVNVGSTQKEVNILFNNTNNVDKEEEQYIKNLKIDNPKYIETDLNYLAVNKENKEQWSYCEKKLNEYFTKKVNDSNIKLVAVIGQGAGNGINLGATNVYLYIFKNGKLYDIRDIENITFIPVVDVPANLTDKELNDYVIKEVNKLYNYDEYGYASISKKADNIYTLNSESEDKEFYNCEIMVKREKATAVTDTDADTKIKLDTTSAVVPKGTTLEAKEVKDGATYNTVVKAVENEVDKFVLYDIYLMNNNAKIQPNGKVKVSIPVPDGYDTSKIVVYRVEENGTKTKLDVTVKDGYITFETDHFSNYVVGEEKTTVSEEATKETTDTSKASNTTKRELDNTPKTGAETNIITVISSIISLVSAGAVALVRKF
ncbi:MAG: hypothetical protein IJK18_04370 [Clostridia bacterium]|nr:hypothetical protein [Clostridia bacterium]